MCVDAKGYKYRVRGSLGSWFVPISIYKLRKLFNLASFAYSYMRNVTTFKYEGTYRVLLVCQCAYIASTS